MSGEMQDAKHSVQYAFAKQLEAFGSHLLEELGLTPEQFLTVVPLDDVDTFLTDVQALYHNPDREDFPADPSEAGEHGFCWNDIKHCHDEVQRCVPRLAELLRLAEYDTNDETAAETLRNVVEL